MKVHDDRHARSCPGNIDAQRQLAGMSAVMRDGVRDRASLARMCGAGVSTIGVASMHCCDRECSKQA
jgi:hypothetical protein